MTVSLNEYRTKFLRAEQQRIVAEELWPSVSEEVRAVMADNFHRAFSGCLNCAKVAT
jgi:hypothetical protein